MYVFLHETLSFKGLLVALAHTQLTTWSTFSYSTRTSQTFTLLVEYRNFTCFGTIYLTVTEINLTQPTAVSKFELKPVRQFGWTQWAHQCHLRQQNRSFSSRSGTHTGNNGWGIWRVSRRWGLKWWSCRELSTKLRDGSCISPAHGRWSEGASTPDRWKDCGERAAEVEQEGNWKLLH